MKLHLIDTVDKAPTEPVIISNLDNSFSENINLEYIEQPIEIGFEDVGNKKLYLKIYDFTSFAKAKNVITDLNLHYKYTTQNEGNNYSIIIGPLENFEANNLVLSFIAKGYKKTEFIIE